MIRTLTIAATTLALSGCIWNGQEVISGTAMGMEDREKTRFLLAAKHAMYQCEYKNELDLVNKRLDDFKEEYQPYFLHEPFEIETFITDAQCEYWKKNVDNWAKTGRYEYLGQGQWIVYQDN